MVGEAPICFFLGNQKGKQWPKRKTLGWEAPPPSPAPGSSQSIPLTPTTAQPRGSTQLQPRKNNTWWKHHPEITTTSLEHSWALPGQGTRAEQHIHDFCCSQDTFPQEGIPALSAHCCQDSSREKNNPWAVNTGNAFHPMEKYRWICLRVSELPTGAAYILLFLEMDAVSSGCAAAPSPAWMPLSSLELQHPEMSTPQSSHWTQGMKNDRVEALIALSVHLINRVIWAQLCGMGFSELFVSIWLFMWHEFLV